MAREMGRALVRCTAGEMTFCTGEDPRESKAKKKEGLRKKDREAPRPNSLLHAFAESWICRPAAAMHYCRARRGPQLPLSVSGSHWPQTPSGGDPEEALPAFASLQSWRTLPTHSLRNCLPLTHPPQLHFSDPSQIKSFSCQTQRTTPDFTVFLLFLNVYNYTSFQLLHFL